MKTSGCAETNSFVGRALLFLLLCCCRLVALVSPLAPAAGYLSADGTYNRLRNTHVGSPNLEVSYTIWWAARLTQQQPRHGVNISPDFSRPKTRLFIGSSWYPRQHLEARMAEVVKETKRRAKKLGVRVSDFNDGEKTIQTRPKDVR